MSKILELNLENEEALSAIGAALSSPARIQILKLLYHSSFNVAEIAEKLQLPTSSAAVYIRALETAGLINTKVQKGSRGAMKICSRKYDNIEITLTSDDPNVDKVYSLSIPIGCYSDCLVIPTCGIASENGIIGHDDRPDAFFLPEHINAQILWTCGGFVSYKIPWKFDNQVHIKSILITFEACSETFNYKEDWISDITISLDDKECGTWRSPGDHGCRRGRLNPSWWPSGSTQFGELVTLEINENGSMINGKQSSGVTVYDFDFSSSRPISLKIENKADAEYVGGFNLFGRHFGDYEQDISISFVYTS